MKNNTCYSLVPNPDSFTKEDISQFINTHDGVSVEDWIEGKGIACDYLGDSMWSIDSKTYYVDDLIDHICTLDGYASANKHNSFQKPAPPAPVATPDPAIKGEVLAKSSPRMKM
jgi:hypothetical protein